MELVVYDEKMSVHYPHYKEGLLITLITFLVKILSNYPFCSEDQSLSGDPVCLPDMTAVTNVGWDHWCLTLGPGLMSTIGDVSRPRSTVSGHGGSVLCSHRPGYEGPRSFHNLLVESAY